MDYEKLYKEALERAKQSLTYPDYPDFMRVDVIFPEFAESEDERIRKALISILKSDFEKDTTIYGISVSDIIDWLENQGEEKVYSVWVGGSEINDYYLTEKEAKKLARKYKENGYDDVIIEKQGKQKTAWSEEDETNLTNTIIMLKKGASLHFTNSSITPCVDWLKSIRPQNKWKPSEEQLNAFEHFVRSIGESGYASPYNNNTKLIYSLLNDLKNL